MSKSKLFRTRRKRRQDRQAMKHGSSAKPGHALTYGRTGSAHKGKLRAGRVPEKAGEKP